MEHHTTWRRRGARGRCVRALLSLLLLPAAAGAANFTVTTLADNGAGSLRDAVDQANRTVGADVITFGAGLSGSIVLSSGAIDIFDALSINGPGAAQLSISGNHASRLFRIGPAGGSRASLTTAISGLSLIDASSPDEGGAIFVDDSDLTIDGCVFRGNSAQRGGGLYAFPSGSTSLILRNTRFENNTATADGGGFGAQDIDNVSLSNVTVSGNTAARSGGGWATYGGRIYVAGGEVSTPELAGAFRAVEVFDPAANNWTKLPNCGWAGNQTGGEAKISSGSLSETMNIQ